MMELPLVSVICVCYNHERFVREALQSVIDQTYKNIEIIVVDDCSTDSSAALIRGFTQQHPGIKFIQLDANVGNCKAFNAGLALAKGEFITDFSTDDVFMPERIAQQVDFFLNRGAGYGVVFTDAVYIDENSNFLYNHYDYLFMHRLIERVPEGDVYKEVLIHYFISPPTLLVKRAVFDSLGGYDEELAYEDFDFWVRSSRLYKFGFLNERLTKVRRVRSSMSSRLYRPGDPQLYSTYLVCKKAQALNRSPEEDAALLKRVRYEFRQSVFSGNVREAKLFYDFIGELGRPSKAEEWLCQINKLKLPLYPLKRWYNKIRYGKKY
jgi:glycosyltransferase involved in cell wall biosynthesis